MFGLDTTILGLGDGGAHYSMICDAASTTYVLTYSSPIAAASPREPFQDGFNDTHVPHHEAAAAGVAHGLICVPFRLFIQSRAIVPKRCNAYRNCELSY